MKPLTHERSARRPSWPQSTNTSVGVAFVLPVNDLRHALDCRRLTELGWREKESWETGLAKTVAWYKRFSGNRADVETALVAHPRRG